MQWKVKRYILGETLPGLLVGVFTFIFVMLMFQMLRLLEFFLIHGVSFHKILDIISSMSIAFLPTVLPMATLFAIVLGVSRLSQDSEIAAFISIGVSPLTLLKPIILLGLVLSFLSLVTSLHLAPNSNRNLEMMMHEISQTKITAAIKENAFTESFANFMIFTLKADSKSGFLEKVFIFDEQNQENPLTIVAQKGHLFNQTQDKKNALWLKLNKGNIHFQEKNHTKIQFDEYEVKLIDSSYTFNHRDKSQNSWNLDDILKYNENPSLSYLAQIELHKRINIALACFILSLFGFTISFSINRRVKTNGFALSLLVIVSFWLFMTTFESLSRNQILPGQIALWIPNIIYGLYSIKKIQTLLKS
jgi:lipopolysaccharide export system permease protein